MYLLLSIMFVWVCGCVGVHKYISIASKISSAALFTFPQIIFFSSLFFLLFPFIFPQIIFFSSAALDQTLTRREMLIQKRKVKSLF